MLLLLFHMKEKKMIIKIDNTEHVVRFGIKFVGEVDKLFSDKKDSYGVGMSYAVPRLMDGDVPFLSKILWLSMCTEKNRPSQDKVDEFVENVDNIEELLAEVMEELKNANATKIKTRQMMSLFEKLKATETQASA